MRFGETPMMAQREGVRTATADQFMYGLVIWGHGGMLAKALRERTTFMSNNEDAAT